MSDNLPENVTDAALAEARREANNTVLSEDTLRGIETLDDALKALSDLGPIENFDDYGDGFEIVTNKDNLIGVSLAFLEWRFTKSKEHGTEFVSVSAVTKDGQKLIINDGSTGMYRQLRNITDERIQKNRPNAQVGLIVSRGLRKSEYDYDKPDGTTGRGVTYYLA